MRKDHVEKRVAALQALRELPDGTAAVAPLREALRDANNYVVSKAAAIAADFGLLQLIPDLLAAFERFLEGGAKTDTQCWAKTALVQALRQLGHDDSEPYRRGIGVVQMEPVWGGSADTAAALRGACALALVTTRLSNLEILSFLTERLVDAEKPVRMDAAAAIGQLGCDEGALLLRLKALSGDTEPEVTGQCFHSLLAVEGAKAISFLRRYLNGEDDELRMEAAIALGQSREPEALELLWTTWKGQLPADLRKGIVLALGASPLRAAAEFLAELIVAHESGEMAKTARRALSTSRYRDEFKSQLRSMA